MAVTFEEIQRAYKKYQEFVNPGGQNMLSSLPQINPETGKMRDMTPEQMEGAMNFAGVGGITNVGKQAVSKFGKPAMDYMSKLYQKGMGRVTAPGAPGSVKAGVQGAYNANKVARAERAYQKGMLETESISRNAGNTPMGLRHPAGAPGGVGGRMSGGLQQADEAILAANKANMLRLAEYGGVGALAGAGAGIHSFNWGNAPAMDSTGPGRPALVYTGDNDPANLTDMNHPMPAAAAKDPVAPRGRVAPRGPAGPSPEAVAAAQQQEMAVMQAVQQKAAQDAYYMSRLNPLGGTSEYADLQRGYLNR